MSLANEVLAAWAPIFRSVRLHTGEKGRFEVTLDGELVFSKSLLGRHAKEGEIARAFEAKIGPPLKWRE